ncbi:mannose-1-phosphate guanylyltransferase/mannose-6-phosphate isomerase [Pseudofulvimonas gallinarii]|nr:mannose-1-phosphate guanylyltransferase/mannose-6-phosphate isomerase [Pseudofulvimonas gallinarii]
MSMLIPVILSGGAGTRLWPVSRRAYPKPFMTLADGDTLLAKTLQRALAVADAASPVLTVTGRDYYFLTRDAYAAQTSATGRELPFLLEPVGRNTAPALMAAAVLLAERHGADCKLLVLPADHLIRDVEGFADAVARARRLAGEGYLVTFGIRPLHPETGYGYIRRGDAIGSDGFEVEAFVEKPDLATAQAYLDSGRYDWNSGMFCFTAAALIEAAEAVAPELLEGVRGSLAGSAAGSPVELSPEGFAALPDISIDYAVMEKAARRAVVPADFDWNDIGSWKAISGLEAADESGNRVRGNAVLVDASDCYVQADKRLVAVVGVRDLVVVDTGDAVLVSDAGRTQDVRKVVEQLRGDSHDAANFHQTVHRPWGSFTVLEDAPDCKVKRLVVKPGQVLSLQKHFRRSEHWTVVQGTAKVRVGDEEFLLERNQSTYIPIDTLHRLENPTDRDIALIEVQCGDYFGEDDIVRLEDVYGRR